MGKRGRSKKRTKEWVKKEIKHTRMRRKKNGKKNTIPLHQHDSHVLRANLVNDLTFTQPNMHPAKTDLASRRKDWQRYTREH